MPETNLNNLKRIIESDSKAPGNAKNSNESSDKLSQFKLLFNSYKGSISAEDLDELLGHAAYYASSQIVEVLLDAGAEPNYQNKSGDTALHQVVEGDGGVLGNDNGQEHAITAKLLLDRGATLNPKTNKINPYAAAIAVAPNSLEHYIGYRHPWSVACASYADNVRPVFDKYLADNPNIKRTLYNDPKWKSELDQAKGWVIERDVKFGFMCMFVIIPIVAITLNILFNNLRNDGEQKSIGTSPSL